MILKEINALLTLENIYEDTLFAQISTYIQKQESIEAIEEVRLNLLGKKGTFSLLMQGLGKVSKEEKPRLGQRINQLKQHAQSLLQEKQQILKLAHMNAKLKKETLDVTLPGTGRGLGRRHPLDQVLKNIQHYFQRNGFNVEYGPEIEDDFHNFSALNIPKHHPARAMQDTFYFSDERVLRTHTSGVQIRTMENQIPPIQMIAPGKVYRRDSDITHTPMFHQIEGLWLDEKVTFQDLKGVLSRFLKYFFESDVKVRFRPSYFPFTEPSAEVDISCIMCMSSNQKDCRICKNTGWLEVLGCGMVHPNVLNACNLDSERYQGFAFGMGVERLTMLKYQIPDLRMLFENDIRFLKQF